MVHRHGPDTGILPAGGGPGPKPDAAVSLWGCCAKGESKPKIEELFPRGVRHLCRVANLLCAGGSLTPRRALGSVLSG